MLNGLEELLKQALVDGSFFWAILLSLGAGFLTSLSPCVYPLIPITLSILGTQRHVSHWHGFLVASCYVAGMVVLYVALGIVFASLGVVAGSTLQNPWVIGVVAMIFIALALSLFGAFELTLPPSLLARLSHVGGKGYHGAFAMGLVAGIVAAPCTGPVLVFILTLIASDGNWWSGSSLMFAYGIGMGFPFLILGAFSSSISRLPKSGPWMDVVKNIFGIVMLAVAFHYLQLVFPVLAQLLQRVSMTGPLFLMALAALGLSMDAMHFSFKHGSVLSRFRGAFGVLCVLAALVGFAERMSEPEHVSTLKWEVIGDKEDAVSRLNDILENAKANKMPVMIDFYADWCSACHELDHYTYGNAQVDAELVRFVRVKLDVTRDSPTLNQIQSYWGVVGLPTVVFVSSSGEELQQPKVFGFMGPAEFLMQLKEIP